MNLINGEFVEDLFEWAKQKEDEKVFPSISQEENSYYIGRDSEETYMMEYEFQSVIEFRKALERYSGLGDDLQLLDRLVVELYQGRFTSNAQESERLIEQSKHTAEAEIVEKALPEYIYVF